MSQVQEKVDERQLLGQHPPRLHQVPYQRVPSQAGTVIVLFLLGFESVVAASFGEAGRFRRFGPVEGAPPASVPEV